MMMIFLKLLFRFAACKDHLQVYLTDHLCFPGRLFVAESKIPIRPISTGSCWRGWHKGPSMVKSSARGPGLQKERGLSQGDWRLILSDVKYDQDLSTQDTTGKVGKKQTWFTDSSWIFFFLYINRGLVTSTIFVHSRYFRRWELQAQAHWSGHLIDGQCRVWASQLRQWRCGQHDRHQSLWRFARCLFFFQSIHPWFPRFSEAEYQRLAVLLVHCGRGSQNVFFVFGLMLFQNSCAQNFLHKLEATPHLNGKHVVFGKVRSAKGAKRGSIECIQCNYYFRRRCKMEFTWNFRLKYDMRPFNLLHKLKIMSCKSSCKICFFCPTALVLGSQPQ